MQKLLHSAKMKEEEEEHQQTTTKTGYLNEYQTENNVKYFCFSLLCTINNSAIANNKTHSHTHTV